MTSPLLFGLSPILRDNYQLYAGATLIWSPVRDLDIGVEGAWINTGMQQGQVLDQTKVTGVTAANFNTLLAAGAIKTVSGYDATQVRFRVQRDFWPRVRAGTWWVPPSRFDLRNPSIPLAGAMGRSMVVSYSVWSCVPPSVGLLPIVLYQTASNAVR